MIERPLIVLGAPRSGTTILTRCLLMHPDLWHLHAESHAILEGPFHPEGNGYESNRVTANELAPAVAEALRERFYAAAVNISRVLPAPGWLYAGNRPARRLIERGGTRMVGAISKCSKPEKIRLLEKTPKNTLRVPMLDALFPDARFLWIRRHPAHNIDSLTAGWHLSGQSQGGTRRFAKAGYAIAAELNLQDYGDVWWRFALPPGWRDLHGKTVADVAAWQYYQCNAYARNDLQALDAERVFALQYEDFVSDPLPLLKQILAWAELEPHPYVEQYATALPRVNDPSGNMKRGREGLRYGDEVHTAIQRLPQLESLQQEFGYSD